MDGTFATSCSISRFLQVAVGMNINNTNDQTQTSQTPDNDMGSIHLALCAHTQGTCCSRCVWCGCLCACHTVVAFAGSSTIAVGLAPPRLLSESQT